MTSEIFASAPLELIHCDIWGPSPNLSTMGYRYYIMFIDDYSRFHWIFPMKDRTESLIYFQHFKTVNENLFSTKIKWFQCDGAFELVKGVF